MAKSAAVKHLNRVLKKVEETYWGRGRLRKLALRGDHQYQYCILGLVELTGTEKPKTYVSEISVVRSYPEVASYLQRAIPTSPIPMNADTDTSLIKANIVNYNDDAKRRTQVTAWLKRAIKLAEKEST